MMISLSVTSELGPNPDPKELQRSIQTKMEEHSFLAMLGYVGMCAAPLAGLGFGIVALIKKTPPRWPAVVALCLIGASVILLCIVMVFLAATMQSGAPSV
ncbi:MAG: hypothetical protein O7B26_05600 [Planctomycetota bacterium]|nr:hypothetical protein [Planctomycetota bacterium]